MNIISNRKRIADIDVVNDTCMRQSVIPRVGLRFYEEDK